MAADVTVSIVIVTYNSAADIADCLVSIARCTSIPYEVLIVDNFSSDETVRIIKEHFPLIQLIENNTNTGFAAANNLAVSQAQGQYIAFLNPDTQVEDQWLEPLIELLHKNPRIGSATSQILYGKDPGRINACGNCVHFSGITYCNQQGKPKISGAPFEVNAVSGAAFAIERSLFEQIGGFPENFFLY